MEIHIWAMILLSAFMHASWNALVKTNASRFIAINSQAIFVGIISLAIIPFLPLPNVDVWWIIAISGIVHVSYNMMLALAYQKGDFSYVYPIARGTSPAIVTLVSILFIKEKISSGEVISIILIITGICSLTLGRKNQIINNYKTLIIALLTGVLISSYTIIDGIGARYVQNPHSYVIWISFVTAVFTLPFTVKDRKKIIKISQENPKVILKIFLGAILSLAGYWIVVFAMSTSPLAPISALREVSIIIAAIIGTIILKEGLSVTRIVSSIIVTSGVILMGYQYI